MRKLFGLPLQRPFGGRPRAISKDSIDIFIGQNHTGSWSFSDAIRSVLGEDQSLALEDFKFAKNPGDVPGLASVLNAQRAAFASLPEAPVYIYSHLPIPVHLALKPADQGRARYFTLMRHPVSRVLSNYYWLVKHKHADVHWVPHAIRDGATLDEWLDDLVDRNVWPSGIWPAEYFYLPWMEAGLVPGKVGTKEYDVARYVLDKYFSYVGITELFDESLYVFARKKNWATLPSWKLLGNSDRPSTTQIVPRIIERIEEFVELDMYLYEHYKARFESEHAEDIRYFRANIKSLRGSEEVNRAPMI